MKFQTLIFILLVSSSLMQDKLTFTPTGVLNQACISSDKSNIYYTFNVEGTSSESTADETVWTATFSSPQNTESKCKMRKATREVKVDISCNITSEIKKEDVILTKLSATGFNDVTLSDSLKVIEKNVECNGCFLGFKFLLLLVFILF